MPIPLVALAGLAAQAVPAIVGLFDSDDDSTVNKAARMVSSVGQSITGAKTDEEAAQLIKADPNLYAEFRIKLVEQSISLYQEESKRLETVNKTIRAEVQSSDPYVRRMRPTFGYIVAITWAGLIGSIIYTIVSEPSFANEVISAIGQLGTMWSVALSVLGVYVYKRSSDKNPPKGPTLTSALATRIMGKHD